MKVKPLRKFASGTIETILSQIPFYADLSINDNEQFSLLLDHSNIIEIEPGETIIKKGAVDKVFYFLLKGRLEIYADENAKNESINHLTPGQVFGALAVINEQPRIATVSSSIDSPATVFATDISIFGKIDDLSQIKLKTKLNFLSIVVNNTRWKLEVYRMNDAEHSLASKIDDIKRFTGEKNTMEELLSLAEQSKQLSSLLNEWNDSMELKLKVAAPEEKKSSLFSMLRNVRNSLT